METVERTDFSSLFSIQKTLADHDKICKEINDIVVEIAPKLNEILAIISQHRANVATAIVTSTKMADFHDVLSKLPKLHDVPGNMFHDTLSAKITECMNTTKSVLQSVKETLETPTTHVKPFDNCSISHETVEPNQPSLMCHAAEW